MRNHLHSRFTQPTKSVWLVQSTLLRCGWRTLLHTLVTLMFTWRKLTKRNSQVLQLGWACQMLTLSAHSLWQMVLAVLSRQLLTSLLLLSTQVLAAWWFASMMLPVHGVAAQLVSSILLLNTRPCMLIVTVLPITLQIQVLAVLVLKARALLCSTSLRLVLVELSQQLQTFSTSVIVRTALGWLHTCSQSMEQVQQSMHWISVVTTSHTMLNFLQHSLQHIHLRLLWQQVQLKKALSIAQWQFCSAVTETHSSSMLQLQLTTQLLVTYMRMQQMLLHSHTTQQLQLVSTRTIISQQRQKVLTLFTKWLLLTTYCSQPVQQVLKVLQLSTQRISKAKVVQWKTTTILTMAQQSTQAQWACGSATATQAATHSSEHQQVVEWSSVTESLLKCFRNSVLATALSQQLKQQLAKVHTMTSLSWRVATHQTSTIWFTISHLITMSHSISSMLISMNHSS